MAIDKMSAERSELVKEMIQTCGCTEARAVKLLSMHNNNVEKAKQHEFKYRSYAAPQADVEEFELSNRWPVGRKQQFDGQDKRKMPINQTLGPALPTGEASCAKSHLAPILPASTTPESPQESSNTNAPSTPSPNSPSPTTTDSVATALSTAADMLTDVHRTMLLDRRASQEQLSLPQSQSGHQEDAKFSLHNMEKDPKTWDFVLPSLPHPGVLDPGVEETSEDFSITTLTAAVSNGVDTASMRRYLDYYPRHVVSSSINHTVEGFPSIFYAVATNDEMIVRSWISYGADVSAVHEDSGVPLLAFAIIHSDTAGENTIQVVTTLLSLGASPAVIPSDLYMSYLSDPAESSFKGVENPSTDAPRGISWCTNAATKRLVKTLNLFHRYNLAKAVKIKQPSLRHKQVAKLRKAEPLLGMPYFLIGQSIAANRVLRELLAYLMIPTKKPLVLVFAGPSGHGKTELARKLGHLLSLDLEIVDCTIVNREMELFGPRHPYTGADRGSPLNNFLAQHSGQRCIVFLDEFEKTTRDIHQALLLPFDNGEYQDRRRLTKVDCSKTIWILATNALDETITSFCHRNEEIFSDVEDVREKSAKKLPRLLKSSFLSRFEAPITGRISGFIPFLPFVPAEQAVVAYKFITELAELVKRPVDLLHGPANQLLGDVLLHVRKDGAVGSALAEEDYHPELGARSLHAAVEHGVKGKLLEAYLAENEEIEQGSGLQEYVVDYKGGEVTVEKIVGQKTT